MVDALMNSACCRGFASAEATKGLSDRPLETFGAATLRFSCGMTCPFLG